jgi:hypothetical protein
MIVEITWFPIEEFDLFQRTMRDFLTQSAVNARYPRPARAGRSTVKEAM